jgi:hypothetical protein
LQHLKQFRSRGAPSPQRKNYQQKVNKILHFQLAHTELGGGHVREIKILPPRL